MKVNNAIKSTAVAVLAGCVLFAFAACEGPMGPEGPQGPQGGDPTGILATQDFNALVTADLDDDAGIDQATYGGDSTSITGTIEERATDNYALEVTYVDAGGNVGNGAWWWSNNNAAFIDEDWIDQSNLPATLEQDRWVRVYFDYMVDGTVDATNPALIMFKPVGAEGGAIEYTDYKYGNIKFEIPAGTVGTGAWKSGYIDMVLGQVSKKAGDEEKWYTGVALSFEFQATNGGTLTLGVDNVVIVGR